GRDAAAVGLRAIGGAGRRGGGTRRRDGRGSLAGVPGGVHPRLRRRLRPRRDRRPPPSHPLPGAAPELAGRLRPRRPDRWRAGGAVRRSAGDRGPSGLTGPAEAAASAGPDRRRGSPEPFAPDPGRANGHAGNGRVVDGNTAAEDGWSSWWTRSAAPVHVEPHRTAPVQLEPQSSTPVQVEPYPSTPVQVEPHPTAPVQVEPAGSEPAP